VRLPEGAPPVLCLLALIIGASLPALPQDRKDAAESNLERLEKEIKQREREKEALEEAARKAAEEARALSEDLVSAAREVRMAEENAMHLEARIGDLEAETASKKEQLDARRGELMKLLSALERLSQRPAVFTLLQPQEAVQTARSASLMGKLVPEINTQAITLREELGILASLQEALSKERFSLKNTLSELPRRQEKLGSLMTRRKAEAKRATAQADSLATELADFARRAESLRELVDKLEQQAAKRRSVAPVPANRGQRPALMPPSGIRRPVAEMKGQLPYPAVGPIVTRFGEVDGAVHVRGIRIRTRQNAQIVAPYDGQVVFAGPFRDYGQLLIISHGNGYHSLLAGLGDLQSIVGQWVLTGEPIGTMSSGQEADELYMELRRNGVSVDPAPWLNRKEAAAR
jgi:septal ring factor EnvC (AmiA/AmiB activator)